MTVSAPTTTTPPPLHPPSVTGTGMVLDISNAIANGINEKWLTTYASSVERMDVARRDAEKARAEAETSRAEAETSRAVAERAHADAEKEKRLAIQAQEATKLKQLKFDIMKFKAIHKRPRDETASPPQEPPQSKRQITNVAPTASPNSDDALQ